jgi:hypothetical protein
MLKGRAFGPSIVSFLSLLSSATEFLQFHENPQPVIRITAGHHPIWNDAAKRIRQTVKLRPGDTGMRSEGPGRDPEETASM